MQDPYVSFQSGKLMVVAFVFILYYWSAILAVDIIVSKQGLYTLIVINVNA